MKISEKNRCFYLPPIKRRSPLNKLFTIIILLLIGMIIISSTLMDKDLKTLSNIILFMIAIWRAIPIMKDLVTKQNACMIDEEH